MLTLAGLGSAGRLGGTLTSCPGKGLAVTDGLFLFLPEMRPLIASHSSTGFCRVHKSPWQPADSLGTFITEG